MVTTLIVWGAIPSSRSPLRGAVAGAARARRGGGDRRRPPWRVFKDVTLPVIKPVCSS
jgi:hypothetical protein